MTREENRIYWKTVVEEQGQSGLPASVFCREHNLKVSQFYRWSGKFQNLTPVRSSNGFIQLIPTTSKGSGWSGIRIRLFDDLSIEVDRGFDPFTLRSAVETLYSKASKA